MSLSVWSVKISKDKTNARLIGDKADGTDDLFVISFRRGWASCTPRTVSGWDGCGIWHATTSAKEESVLKSSEKQRGKSSDLT